METLLIIAAIVVIFIILFKVAKVMLRIVLVLMFLGLAYLMNPGLVRHRKAVEKKAQEAHLSMHNRDVVVEDFYLFSLTKVRYQQNERFVGAGAFLQVWIVRSLE